MSRRVVQPDMRITHDDLEWWLDLAPDLSWQFATSMPDAPHSYVVRNRTLHDPDFLRAVKVIRTFGQPGKFWERTNIYLTVGNLKWWTMGDTLEGTIIINMATTEKVYGKQDAPRTRSGVWDIHDTVATEYDSWYQTPQALAENDHMRRVIQQHFGAVAPLTLDVGCGTGLLLDLHITAPGMFTGIDPSQAMLNELLRKHPRVRDIHAGRAEDTVPHLLSERLTYDLVVSLFGSPSHVPGQTLTDLLRLTRRGGLLVLMTYVKGYLPHYYGDYVPEHLDSSREAAFALQDRPDAHGFDLNAFDVTVVAP